MGNGAIAGKKEPVKSVVTSPFQGIEPPANGDIISYLNNVFMEKADDVALVGLQLSLYSNLYLRRRYIKVGR